MLPGAAALVLVAAQTAACIQAPLDAAALAEQSEDCLATLFAEQQTLGRSRKLPAYGQCATLSAALADSHLPGPWRETLEQGATACQILDIAALLRSYQARRPAFPFKPDFARLDALLAETLEETRESGWWERALSWLQEKIDRHRDSQVGHLFERLAGFLPPAWVVEVIVKGALVLLALLALMVVLNVLRDEGVRDWWRTLFTRSGRRADTPTEPGSPGPDWSQVVALPASRQAGALLRYVIDTLIRRGLLASDRSRTNRELCQELRRLHGSVGKLFCRFTGRAEPFVYGALSPGSNELQQLRDDARRLITADASPEAAAK